MSFPRILSYIAVFSVWAALAVGVQLWRKSGNSLVKLIVVYLGFIALVEGAGYYYASRGINNLWLSHVYIPIEYALFCLMFYYTFKHRLIRWGLLVSVVVFVAFCIVDSLYIESMLQFNSYPRTAESMLLIGISLMYFYKVFNELDLIYLERDPMFLLSAGLIIYFAGVTALYSFINLMIAQSNELNRYFLSIVYVFNIFLSCLLALVMWRSPKC